MIKVLFVCLGNICRSPMAEFIFKDMVKKQGLENLFYIQSAGTSNEEYGNPVHYEAKEKLKSVGISAEGKYATQLKSQDYEKFDYIIAMDKYNIRNIYQIIGEDYKNKVYSLLDFSDNPRDIADPWYTGNFDVTYNDITEGLTSFLKYILSHRLIGIQATIINSKNEILISKRSNKKKEYPGFWESNGGALEYGETCVDGVLREIKEELGLILNKEEAILLKTVKRNKYIKIIYLFYKDFDIKDVKFKDGEVDEAKWIKIDEFIDMYNKGQIVPNVDFSLEDYNRCIELIKKGRKDENRV